MRTDSIMGRSLFVAAAFAFASPISAQTTAQTEPTVLPLLDIADEDSIPQGLDIPSDEAEQMRGGGKIKVALVVLKKGKTLVYKFITCTSSSNCRNAAFKRYGREAVKQVFWSTGIAGAQKLACKAGFQKLC